MSKKDLYLWLANLLNIPLSQAHISFLGEYYCRLVIDERGIDALLLMHEGYTAKEIAVCTGQSPNLVTATVSKARKILRTVPELKQLYNEFAQKLILIQGYHNANKIDVKIRMKNTI